MFFQNGAAVILLYLVLRLSPPTPLKPHVFKADTDSQKEQEELIVQNDQQDEASECYVTASFVP